MRKCQLKQRFIYMRNSIFKIQIIQYFLNSMKKRVEKLQSIPVISKREASYEKLMLEMMSKLVSESRESNTLIKQQCKLTPASTIYGGMFKDRTNIQDDRGQEKQSSFVRSSNQNEPIVEQVEESISGHNLRPKKYLNSASTANLKPLLPSQNDSKMQSILSKIERRLQISEQINRKLLSKLQTLENNKVQQSRQEQIKTDLQIIEKAITDKVQSQTTQKNSYSIISQILPYSDRREMKVKFKISDLVKKDCKDGIEMQIETSEWLGMVYRATASICWNMLLNNYLTFDEIKILFTENIVFNFIEFMNQLKKMGKIIQREALTAIINEKSVDVLDFLCKQYPQTKIEAPNITLRSLLPQIDNQGRIKYDLIARSGIAFKYNQDGDYTQQIMKMINFMIDKTNDDFENFFTFMRTTFEQVYYPIHKRNKMDENNDPAQKEVVHDDLIYKEKVKSYTKYLIGRKISKNTAKYSDEQIQDGIFFVKSSGVLRIITKWVEELMEYFQKPEQKIKNSYSQSKDHNGKLIYISALIKNGLYKEILKDKQFLMEKIESIKAECYKMEMLLTGESFISDKDQVHLSQEQIRVGMYCSNLKSAISSYICSQLNQLIHHLLKIPISVDEDELGGDEQDFKSQARKDLDCLNLLTFKIFDLLRCKIHSNEEEIVWIVQYLLTQNKLNKDRFNIVRIKDRLNQGTRDIMINAQIQKGLVCQIQLSVTSNSDKKQELLDQYNHFLYELKRSKLGPVTENVSIWSTLEQRFSYFEQILKDKSKKERNKRSPCVHKCGNEKFNIFKRPIICYCCNNFYAIPQTCLLNVNCSLCNETLCGECFYYNYLNQHQRKLYIFDRHKLLNTSVMEKLKEYTDFTKPLPQTGFFIKKKFLKKEMSFYMAIEKNKDDKIKDAPSIEIILVQSIIRGDQLINRQLNKKDIEARLQNGQFYIKDYEETELNNMIIFYFQKKENKKLIKLSDLEKQMRKPQNTRTKVLNIVKQPSYISNLHLLRKQSQKIREMNLIDKVIKDNKVVVYMFNNLFILAQPCVKGSQLRQQIIKKVNTSCLKDFAQKQSDIVMMQNKKMTTELDDLSIKIRPNLYEMFSHNIKKLFLANGFIASIQCFAKFINLQFVVISENCLTTLEGIQNLDKLVSFRFDRNQISSLQPFTNLKSMRYISGNKNEIKSLKGLQNLDQLRSLSLYENQIQSIEQIKDIKTLQELYLRENPIKELKAVETMPSLIKLFIGKTKITELPNLSKLTALQTVSLQSLNLNQVPNIFGQVKLTELYLGYNNITKINNLQNQTELLTLNLSFNKIEAIQNLQFLDKLQVLKLKNNNIKIVKGVKDLDSLKYLSLKFNPIDHIDQLLRFEITFKYDFSNECLTENAKKQMQELQQLKENTSEGQD